MMAAAVTAAGAALLIWHPETPLPDEWNPTKPLEISAPLTAITNLKLQQTVKDDAACLAALAGQDVVFLPPLTSDNPACGIDPRIELRGVGKSVLSPVQTTCAIGLRLAMWERHGVQPAARTLLGTDVSRIEHQSSYACRPIRTPDGTSDRMSMHATAEAIDIRGFRLADGQVVSLSEDWGTGGAKSAFLRAVRNSSCAWFATTLGPDYNALHADHFHLQSRGWGLCR